MSTTPRPPQIIPYLFYRDVPAALDFLCNAFGFKEEMRESTPSGGMHGEASFQGQLVMMGQGAEAQSLKPPSQAGAATSGVFIYLDEVDKHYAAAKEAGAEIVHPPKNVPYGRIYWAVDPEGHPWFFTAPPNAG
jgi:PhnB protein